MFAVPLKNQIVLKFVSIAVILTNSVPFEFAAKLWYTTDEPTFLGDIGNALIFGLEAKLKIKLVKEEITKEEVAEAEKFAKEQFKSEEWMFKR